MGGLLPDRAINRLVLICQNHVWNTCVCLSNCYGAQIRSVLPVARRAAITLLLRQWLARNRRHQRASEEFHTLSVKCIASDGRPRFVLVALLVIAKLVSVRRLVDLWVAPSKSYVEDIAITDQLVVLN